MGESIYRLISLAGFFLVAFMAWVTGSRQKINTKIIMGSMALAWILGTLTFWISWSRSVLQWVNDFLAVLLSASRERGIIPIWSPLPWVRDRPCQMVHLQ